MFLLKTWLILLYESLFFSCCLYNSLFIFNFVSIISMSWCQFLGFIFIGTFCEFWTWICVSFFRLGKFLSIIISNTFSAPFSLSLYSFWTPYNTDVCCCLRGPLNYFYLNFLFWLGDFHYSGLTDHWYIILCHLTCHKIILVYFSFQLLPSSDLIGSFYVFFLVLCWSSFWILCPLPEFSKHFYCYYFEFFNR